MDAARRDVNFAVSVAVVTAGGGDGEGAGFAADNALPGGSWGSELGCWAEAVGSSGGDGAGGEDGAKQTGVTTPG